MAILKKSQLKELNPAQMQEKLTELSAELSAERMQTASGGSKPNSGRLRTLRRTIARIATLLRKRKAQSLAKKAPNAAPTKTPT